MQSHAALRTAALISVVASGVVTPAVTAQSSIHATKVVAFDDKGQAGGGIFNPQNALGAPNTASVHSLGNGGSLTLGFAVTIVDGKGADLIVFENPFRSTSDAAKTFAEVCFVEVSSNGTDFARVPSRYTGPQVDPGPFSFVNSGYYEGLAGTWPSNRSATDPQDIVNAGGDPIDLATLRKHPLVTAGKVDLQKITQVRLVDARSGIDKDSTGTLIRDPGTGSADIDAVTVVNHSGNQSANRPNIDVDVAPNGSFSVTLGDPNGIGDLDLARVRAAVWGVEIPAVSLLSLMQVQSATPTTVKFVYPSSLPASLRIRLSISARDMAGNGCGASDGR